ncbi:hypothetical protein PC120_g28446 [Phytophthora cactorum]|nr:hypothetical protein PC120_g28446 [Phytophthora cactorum]
MPPAAHRSAPQRHKFPNGSTPRQPKPPPYFATNTAGSKAKPRTATVHRSVPPQQEERPISALFSRSQPYRESNTPPLNAAADKPVADWPHRQPPQPTTSRFSSKEKYSSVHFKGLAGSPKATRKTPHVWRPHPPTTRKEESQV